MSQVRFREAGLASATPSGDSPIGTPPLSAMQRLARRGSSAILAPQARGRGRMSVRGGSGSASADGLHGVGRTSRSVLSPPVVAPFEYQGRGCLGLQSRPLDVPRDVRASCDSPPDAKSKCQSREPTSALDEERSQPRRDTEGVQSYGESVAKQAPCAASRPAPQYLGVLLLPRRNAQQASALAGHASLAARRRYLQNSSKVRVLPVAALPRLEIKAASLPIASEPANETSLKVAGRTGLEPSERCWRNLHAVRGLASQQREREADLDETGRPASARESTGGEGSRAGLGQCAG
jgi:hypothetical protein